METKKPGMSREPEEESEELDDMGVESPEKLGPYELAEEVQPSEFVKGELYRGTHEETGASALVHRSGAGEGEPPGDLRARYISSSTHGYTAVEVEAPPGSAPHRKLRVEELLHAFEAIHAGMGRIARLLAEPEPPLRRNRGRALAGAAAVCTVLFAGVALAPMGCDVQAPDEVPSTFTNGTLLDPKLQAPGEISKKVPKEPLKGQVRPPCKSHIQKEINGGCWVPHKMKAPCHDELYEHEGECYMPIFTPPPDPNAGED